MDRRLLWDRKWRFRNRIHITSRPARNLLRVYVLWIDTLEQSIMISGYC